MRWVGILLAGVFMLFSAAPSAALTPSVIDPTIQLDAGKQILISSVYAKRGEVLVEIYNNTEQPVDLSGWKVRFLSTSSEADVLLPSGWLLSDSFISLSENYLVPGVFGFGSLDLPLLEAIEAIQVLDTNDIVASSVANFPADITTKWYQRKSSGMSGTFINDFSAATASTKLRHTPLYLPPLDRPRLRIVEIYPHASDCAPTDVSVLCGDYIKLYNPTEAVARVADFRLRSDSSASESSNAFHLDAYDDVMPGGFLTISLRDDGDKLNLTDDGGWVWLEDAAGIIRYEETSVAYPSASSTSKIGYAWALAADATWQWTATPMPSLANSFPVSEPGLGGGVLSEVAECPQGKYRNPETNRCRNIEDAITTLAVCAEGQSRNPATNRCRSTASTANVILSPCAANQERNPETNRCRSTTSASTLVPCLANQERNPETNRCRKTVLDTVLSPASIEPADSKTSAGDMFVTTLVGIAGVGAVGYGIYEWRSELLGMFRKIIVRISKK